ncbi:hypothetical protein [Citrobacter koseri]|uniref:hypothetical protein n=1 Tax=Citrobacter koseri TaxID=545 RepID=UPI001F368EC1|nr:hypothetical protein [Citrobacter koseri]
MMLTPSLTLNMSAVTDGSADRQQKIFSNVGNTTGIGFVVKNTVGGSSTLEDGVNTNLVTVADPRVSLGEAGFSPGNGEQVLLVGLACGSAMDCSMTRLRAGVAKLTITFAFEYQ